MIRHLHAKRPVRGCLQLLPRYPRPHPRYSLQPDRRTPRRRRKIHPNPIPRGKSKERGITPTMVCARPFSRTC